MNILLIDDTVTERIIMDTLLRNLGHEVTCAQNGIQALEFYPELNPDLVLLDVVMPVMDGYETTRRIRALDQGRNDWTPVILLSGRTNANDIATGIDAGADDYLPKPVDLIVLTAKMQAMQRIAAMRRRLMEVSTQLEEANAELQKLATIDELTSLTNRRHMNQHLERMLQHCGRVRAPLSIIMVDIDYFKNYNDQYGHLAGDNCLKQIAKLFRRSISRPADMVARYGGEEFAIILPETPLEGARHLAEELRTNVQELGIQHTKSFDYGCVTASFGIASCVPDTNTTVTYMLHQADQALYAAKNGGRNRVET